MTLLGYHYSKENNTISMIQDTMFDRPGGESGYVEKGYFFENSNILVGVTGDLYTYAALILYLQDREKEKGKVKIQDLVKEAEIALLNIRKYRKTMIFNNDDGENLSSVSLFFFGFIEKKPIFVRILCSCEDSITIEDLSKEILDGHLRIKPELEDESESQTSEHKMLFELATDINNASFSEPKTKIAMLNFLLLHIQECEKSLSDKSKVPIGGALINYSLSPSLFTSERLLTISNCQLDKNDENTYLTIKDAYELTSGICFQIENYTP